MKINSDLINITVLRDTFNDVGTLGKLYINGFFICDTLEPPITLGSQSFARNCCVPAGVYKVSSRMSSRFKCRKYYLNTSHLNRNGICFHAGNVPSHTKGCVLLGVRKGDGFVLVNSGVVTSLVEHLFDALFASTFNVKFSFVK